jgi:hypothetical protein
MQSYHKQGLMLADPQATKLAAVVAQPGGNGIPSIAVPNLGPHAQLQNLHVEQRYVMCVVM